MSRRRRTRKPARALTSKQGRRLAIMFGSVALFAILVGVWTFVAVVVDSNRKISALYESANANYSKLVAVGEKPIGPPPAEIVGKPGPTGPAGPTGQTGAAGAPGRDGRDGRDATPEQVARAVAAWMTDHPARAGQAGAAGANGVNGANGDDGTSPACLAEPGQCQGAAGSPGPPGAPGPAGPAGKDGANGTNGSNGQPPSAWRWTDPVTKVSFECRRDSTSPDTAPAYSCTTT